jgi:hypothetical protein
MNMSPTQAKKGLEQALNPALATPTPRTKDLSVGTPGSRRRGTQIVSQKQKARLIHRAFRKSCVLIPFYQSGRTGRPDSACAI